MERSGEERFIRHYSITVKYILFSMKCTSKTLPNFLLVLISRQAEMTADTLCGWMRRDGLSIYLDRLSQKVGVDSLA